MTREEREKAIEYFRDAKGLSSAFDKAANMAIEALSEPKTGEWLEMGINADGTHNIKCDQCGEGFKTRGHARSYNTNAKYKFCPSCGARMKGENNEAD